MRRMLVLSSLLLTACIGTARVELRKDVEVGIQTSTSKEAFLRAEARLARATVGMRQDQFCELMGMTAVGEPGRAPALGWMDGHLQAASLRLEAKRGRPKGPTTHLLVFGYQEDEKENRRLLVVFEDGRLVSIEKFVAPELAANKE